MAESVEHKFISSKFNEVLQAFASTKLIGISESDRKRLDYCCIIERDCSRPLVSQVLWGHTEGIEKDLRILLHDKEALIKTYFVRDSVKHRRKIDEILFDYRSKIETNKLLIGLRVFFLPPDFDADHEKDRQFMERYLSHQVCNDLLFWTTFGNLTKFDVAVFSNHGGPLGLKFAILDEINKNGLTHTPTFKDRLGYKTNGPIREATTMLVATGLVKQYRDSVMLFPTLKGRMLIDLTKRILWERKLNLPNSTDLKFADELKLIIARLMPDSVVETGDNEDNSDEYYNTLSKLIHSAEYCKNNWGRDLLDNFDHENIKFYSKFNWQTFQKELHGVFEISPEFFNDTNSLFFAENNV